MYTYRFSKKITTGLFYAQLEPSCLFKRVQINSYFISQAPTSPPLNPTFLLSKLVLPASHLEEKE